MKTKLNSKNPKYPDFDPTLYLVLDPLKTNESNFESFLKKAINGGVTLVQLREKDCSNEEFEKLAKRLLACLEKYRVPFIINDRVDIAKRIGAQGVHLGQSDSNWEFARNQLGEEALIGVSVENLAQAKNLENARIEYLGVSSIFSTVTKKNIKEIWGLEKLAELRKETSHLLVGIGGINELNARKVIEAGADGVAVISALTQAKDPEGTARNLKLALVRQLTNELSSTPRNN